MRRSRFAALGLLAVIGTAGWIVALSHAEQDVPKAQAQEAAPASAG